MLGHGRHRFPTRFRTAFFVLVGTGVSIVSTVHIGCGAAPEPEETGPIRIVLEEEGLGVLDLPDGCTRVEPGGHALELACELLETLANPAGPEGRIHLELGEPTDRHIELVDISVLETIREEHRTLFEALPGGEFLGAGGAIIYGPFGPSRYTRGRYRAENGEMLQRIRLFTVHPMQNRLVSLVYDHPPGNDDDTKARLNNHLFILLENLRSLEELPDVLPGDEDGAATDGPATN